MNLWDKTNLTAVEFQEKMRTSLSNCEFITTILNSIKSPPYSIIDFGCGPGALINFIDTLKCQYLGIDSSETFITYCQKEYPIVKDQFIFADICRFKDDVVWDFGVFNSVLQFNHNYLDVLKNASSFCSNFIILNHQTQNGPKHIRNAEEMLNGIRVPLIKFSRKKFIKEMKEFGEVKIYDCNKSDLLHVKVKK